MIQILIVLITLISKSEGNYQTVFDLTELDSTHHYYGENYEFEDGSFIRTNANNNQTISGCTPFKTCSNIQIDTPYEDYFSSEHSNILYQIESIIKAFQTFQ